MFDCSPAYIRSKLIAFWRAKDGVTAIEFGMVGIPFFMLILGIMCVSLMMFYRTSLDFATQKAARALMVGTPQTSGYTANQFITNSVCAYLPSPMFTCGSVVINLVTVTETVEPTAYVNYVNANMSAVIVPPLNNAQNKYCPGSGSSYEILEVLYPLPLYLRPFDLNASDFQGQTILMSTATFRNEPFSGAPAAAAGC